MADEKFLTDDEFGVELCTFGIYSINSDAMRNFYLTTKFTKDQLTRLFSVGLKSDYAVELFDLCNPTADYDLFTVLSERKALLALRHAKTLRPEQVDYALNAVFKDVYQIAKVRSLAYHHPNCPDAARVKYVIQHGEEPTKE